MDDSTVASTIPVPSDMSSSPPETPTQEAARLRRERRNAKIQAGGASRLAQITSLSGRPAAAQAELGKSAPPNSSLNTPQTTNRPLGSSTSTAASSVYSEDPEEVDISSMFQHRPRPNADTPMDMGNPNDIFRQMLMGGGGSGGGPPQGFPGMDFPGMGAEGQGARTSGSEDPIMAMMQQMMGGQGGGGAAGMPDLASMLNGGGFPGFPGQTAAPVDSKAQIWRILHAICALLLGIYTITFSSTAFSGSKLARDYQDISLNPPKLFWMFATMELVLQSTRYFMDGGHLPPSGILGTVGQFLPEPYSGYVRIFARYSVYYTALVADVSLVVFVLGVAAWWRGAGVVV